MGDADGARSMGNFGSGVSPIIADGMVILLRDVTKDAKAHGH